VLADDEDALLEASEGVGLGDELRGALGSPTSKIDRSGARPPTNRRSRRWPAASAPPPLTEPRSARSAGIGEAEDPQLVEAADVELAPLNRHTPAAS
jgi:hypothetical protein